MKILVYSPAFFPSIGGLEMMVAILAHEFVQHKHQVKLICQTPIHKDNPANFSFEIIRQPKPMTLLENVHWCDLFFQANISLRGVWPLLFIHKPYVVSHQGWYARGNGQVNWQDRLKYLVTGLAHNISASTAVAKHIPQPSHVIPNTYRDDLFYEIPSITRNKQLVFLGRLVSDKGADLLLVALAKLKQMGVMPNLTVIGKGPEEAQLRKQAIQLQIADQVEFVGLKVGEELVQLLNTHQIMVVPSRWNEPFGIVALEGIACGCVVVGSEGGGLRDAIGPCGMTFPNGDAMALTQILFSLLTETIQIAEYRKQAKAHLARHKPAAVAKAYLQVFEQALQ